MFPPKKEMIFKSEPIQASNVLLLDYKFSLGTPNQQTVHLSAVSIASLGPMEVMHVCMCVIRIIITGVDESRLR